MTTEETPGPSQRDALDLWTALVLVRGVVGDRLAERLESGLGLLPEEADLLLGLEAAPEQRLRMADVSRRLGVGKSQVTRLVDRLEARGLVERAACPQDRRVVYAGLTPAGGAVAAEAAPLLAAAAEEHLACHLSAAEVDATLAALRAVLVAEGAGA